MLYAILDKNIVRTFGDAPTFRDVDTGKSSLPADYVDASDIDADLVAAGAAVYYIGADEDKAPNPDRAKDAAPRWKYDLSQVAPPPAADALQAALVSLGLDPNQRGAFIDAVRLAVNEKETISIDRIV